MRTRNPARSGRLLAALALLGLAATPAGADPLYRITDLGEIGGDGAGATGLNASGQATVSTSTSLNRSFLYSAGRVTDLNALIGNYGYAGGINDAGHVVGNRSDTGANQRRAYLYRDGRVTDLGTLDGGSSAFGVNNAGQVVGGASVPGGNHAFLYSDGQLTDLGMLGGSYSAALDLNDAGHVVGWSYLPTRDPLTAPDTHAFLYKDGRRIDLGTLGGPHSFAQQINNAGQVVGDASTGDGSTHAFLYSNGRMIDLGILPEGGWSRALGLNAHGQVVGVASVPMTPEEAGAVLCDSRPTPDPASSLR